MLTPERRVQRARAAALARHHPDQAEPRRTLKAEAAERYIRKLSTEFPPLTADQRIRLGVLLLTSADGGAA
jgi:hypothetical protein